MTKARGKRQNADPEPLPPADIGAERALLGAMLLEGQAAGLALDMLSPVDFYRSAHRKIFGCMRGICDAGDDPDELLVRDALETAGILEDIGGADYIHELATSVPSAANMESYAGIVKERSVQRKLISACTASLREAEDGGDVQTVVERAKERIGEVDAPAGGPKRMARQRNMADVDAEPIRWLLFPYLPLGTIVFLEGDGGGGKSSLSLALAAAVTRGGTWPDALTGKPSPPTMEPGTVIIMTAEDSLSRTVKPRLDKAEADPRRVIALEGTTDGNGLTLLDLDVLEAVFAEHRPKLFVADPITAYAGKTNLNYAHEVRPLMAGLTALAGKYDTAILLIRHLRKSSADRSAYRGMGSADLGAAVRVALLAGKDPRNPEVRAVVVHKSNLGPEGASMGYAIDEKGDFYWTGRTDLTAARILEADPEAGDNSKIDDAAEWLQDALADGEEEGPKLKAAAKKAGISAHTLRRAREKIGIKPFPGPSRPGGRGRAPWIWRLPEDRLAQDGDRLAQDPYISGMDKSQHGPDRPTEATDGQLQLVQGAEVGQHGNRPV